MSFQFTPCDHHVEMRQVRNLPSPVAFLTYRAAYDILPIWDDATAFLYAAFRHGGLRKLPAPVMVTVQCDIVRQTVTFEASADEALRLAHDLRAILVEHKLSRMAPLDFRTLLTKD